MKVTELREMTIDELKQHEIELAEELARLRLQLALKRLDNPLKMRTAKRDFARVKTILAERARTGETPSAAAARAAARKTAAAPKAAKQAAPKDAEPARPAEEPDKA
jgi:large subunit ribosomal protein L29